MRVLRFRGITRLLTAAEVTLLLATAGLGVAWIRNPNAHYDGLTVLSGVATGALELVRRRSRRTAPERELANHLDQIKEAIAELRLSIQDTPNSSNVPQVEPTPPRSQDAVSDPVFERILSLVQLRSVVDRRLATLARHSGLDSDQNPLVIVDQLQIPPEFKQALKSFYEYASSLPNENEHMTRWAQEHGKNMVDMLDYFNGVARRPT